MRGTRRCRRRPAEAGADAAVQIGLQAAGYGLRASSVNGRSAHRSTPIQARSLKSVAEAGHDHAESQTRNSPPRQAQEAARPRQGLLPDQEQAVSRRQGSGRHGAQVRLRRPPEQEARFRRLWVVRINAAARENGLDLLAVDDAASRPPASRSTARCWPTWPCPSRRRSPRSPRKARKAASRLPAVGLTSAHGRRRGHRGARGTRSRARSRRARASATELQAVRDEFLGRKSGLVTAPLSAARHGRARAPARVRAPGQRAQDRHRSRRSTSARAALDAQRGRLPARRRHAARPRRRARPSSSADAGARAGRGHLRPHGLRDPRRSRGRRRLPQLRSAQHAAGSSRARHAGHALSRASPSRVEVGPSAARPARRWRREPSAAAASAVADHAVRRRCCARTRRRCRSAT